MSYRDLKQNKQAQLEKIAAQLSKVVVKKLLQDSNENSQKQ